MTAVNLLHPCRRVAGGLQVHDVLVVLVFQHKRMSEGCWWCWFDVLVVLVFQHKRMSKGCWWCWFDVLVVLIFQHERMSNGCWWCWFDMLVVLIFQHKRKSLGRGAYALSPMPHHTVPPEKPQEVGPTEEPADAGVATADTASAAAAQEPTLKDIRAQVYQLAVAGESYDSWFRGGHSQSGVSPQSRHPNPTATGVTDPRAVLTVRSRERKVFHINQFLP